MADNQIETCWGWKHWVGGGRQEITKFNQYWSKGSTLRFLTFDPVTFWPLRQHSSTCPPSVDPCLLYIYWQALRDVCIWTVEVLQLSLSLSLSLSKVCGSIFLIATIRGQRRIPPNTLTSLHPQPSPVSTSRTDALADLFASATSERPCWRFAQENLIPTLSIRLWLLKQRLKTTGNQISAEKNVALTFNQFQDHRCQSGCSSPSLLRAPLCGGFCYDAQSVRFPGRKHRMVRCPSVRQFTKMIYGSYFKC